MTLYSIIFCRSLFLFQNTQKIKAKNGGVIKDERESREKERERERKKERGRE